MSRIARLVVAALAASALLSAAEVVGTITLKGGRVLHDAKILNDEPSSVVIFAAEGMIKVKKIDLPADLAARYPARAEPPVALYQTLSQVPPPAAPQAPKPKPRPTPRPTPTPVVPLFSGCSIASFQPRQVQGSLGCFEVTFHNTTSTDQTLTPGEVLCTGTDGSHHQGREFFDVSSGVTVVKRRDVVPAGGDLTTVVYFSNDEIPLDQIKWARPSNH